MTLAYEDPPVDLEDREAMEKAAREPIGKRIASALNESGYTHGRVSVLARAIGVSPNTIYRLRKGELAPSIFTLASLAKITGKPMQWFMEDFQQPALAVFHEWRRAHPEAPEHLASQLETLELDADTRPTLTFYNVALAALAGGATLSEAVTAARAVLRAA